MRYGDLIAEEIDVGSATLVSVDVEDYFHEVPDGEGEFERRGLVSNLPANVDRLLDLFAAKGVRATFFVLGCSAHRIKPQIARMTAEGHEIASHGFGHERATWIAPDVFRADLRKAKAALEDMTGRPVLGYRAPFFAVTPRNLWALDEIRDAGFVYDSSVCPVKNFAYGIPDAPERPHRLKNGLIEWPLSQTRLFGYRFMISGGFYLRAYPFWFMRLLHALRDPRLPRVLYIHPWENDEPSLNPWDAGIDHPALRWKPRLMKWIVTYNRRSAFPRFAALLERFPGGRALSSALPA